LSRKYGRTVCVAEQRVERGLKDRVPSARLLAWACPAISPDPRQANAAFEMLKGARMGAFAAYRDGRIASTPEATGAIRR
jgi:hypothetical protein